jgi:two-component system, OmpR family, response regulator
VRILIVEDDLDLAASLQRVMRREGFDCDVEHDGEIGLQRAASEVYDLIVLDIMLPTLNGFKICGALRDQNVWTPILMLTAKSGEWDEAESLETGADDYLTKPVSTVVLLAHVRALIRRSRLGDVSALSVEGLALDPIRKRCSDGSTQITLSGREVEVLAFLMLQQGAVVSKSKVISAVWGDSFEGDQNIVEVYVRNLRRKLDAAFGQKFIETVRGSGYSIPANGVVR